MRLPDKPVSRNGLYTATLGVIALSAILTVASCALTATRPVQDMSDTTAAIRAAKEVQADTLAPDLYREANEWFSKARKEYKFKNFSFAQEYAVKARKLAEKAEFAAITNGGSRTDIAPPDQTLTAPEPSPSPYDYPTPQGTPADVYEQRKAEDDARKAAEEKAASQQTPTSTPTPAVLAPPPIVINTGTPGLGVRPQ